MAERYEGINTLNFKKTIAAGTSGLSDGFDIRDISKNGNFSLSYITAPSGGAATCGSSFFILHGCPVFDGTYVNLGTFGTAAVAAGESGNVSISIPVIPFLKLEGSAGTNGAVILQAFIHVR